MGDIFIQKQKKLKKNTINRISIVYALEIEQK